MDCTASSDCGWCEDVNFPEESKCMPGTMMQAQAPYTCKSNNGSNLYQYQFCVQAACSAYTNCRECNRAPACGWCADGRGGGKCTDGDRSGPRVGFCPEKQWTRGMSDVCPGEEYLPCSRHIQFNQFRGGPTLDNMFLSKNDPQECAVKCWENKACKAWSFEFKAGRPYCWLRSEALLPVKETHTSATGLRARCYAGDTLNMIVPSKYLSCKKGMTPDSTINGEPYDVIALDDPDPQFCALECNARSDCKGWAMDMVTPRNKYNHPFVDKYTAQGAAANLPWARETDPLILFSPAANSRSVVMNEEGIPFSLPPTTGFRPQFNQSLSYFTPEELGVALSKKPYEQELYELGKLFPRAASEIKNADAGANRTTWWYHEGLEDEMLFLLGNGSLELGKLNISLGDLLNISLGNSTSGNSSGTAGATDSNTTETPAAEAPKFGAKDLNLIRTYFHKEGQLLDDIGDQLQYPATKYGSVFNDPKVNKRHGYNVTLMKCKEACDYVDGCISFRYETDETPCLESPPSKSCRACFLHKPSASGSLRTSISLSGLESWWAVEPANKTGDTMKLPTRSVEEWRARLRMFYDPINSHFVRFGQLTARPTKHMNRYMHNSARDVISVFPAHKASCAFFKDKAEFKGKSVFRKGSYNALRSQGCEADMPKRKESLCRHGAKISKSDLVTCSVDCPMPWTGPNCNVCGLRLMDCDVLSPNHFKYITDDCKCASACLDNSTCPHDPKSPLFNSRKNPSTCGCDSTCSYKDNDCTRKSRHHLARVNPTTCVCENYCIANASVCPLVLSPDARSFTFDEEKCSCDETCASARSSVDMKNSYVPRGQNVTASYCGMQQSFQDTISSWPTVQEKRANIVKLGMKRYDFLYLLKDTEAHYDDTVQGKTRVGKNWSMPVSEEPEDANNVPIGRIVMSYDPKLGNSGTFTFSTDELALGSYALRWLHEVPMKGHSGKWEKQTTVLTESHFTIGDETCTEPVKVSTPIVNRKNKDPIKVSFCGAPGFKPDSQPNKAVKGDFCGVYLKSDLLSAKYKAVHYTTSGADKGEFSIPSDKLPQPGQYEVRCFNSGQQKAGGKPRGRAQFEVIGEPAVTPRSSWGAEGAPQTPDLPKKTEGLGEGKSAEEAAKVNNLPEKETVPVPGSASRPDMTVGISKDATAALKEDIITAAGVAADGALAQGKSQAEAQAQVDAKAVEMQPPKTAPPDAPVVPAGTQGAVDGPAKPSTDVEPANNMNSPAANADVKVASTLTGF